MRPFRFFCVALTLSLAVVLAPPVRAQESVFIQIEALPTLTTAQTRARAYANAFPNVNGFRMTTGWYAISLGPYGPNEAQRTLSALRSERLIPGDSYLAAPSSYQTQFWPAGASSLTAPIAVPAPTPEAPVVATPAPEPAPEIDETPREARASERLLLEAERKEIQEALQWDGYYRAGIDGAFGPGTRQAMADWQRDQGFDVTGVLTTRQRAQLIDDYRAIFADLGLSAVTDQDAGIEIVLPLGQVAYARTDAPFVHYDAQTDAGTRVLLISQVGDEATLFGLFDSLQTLEIVPAEGPRRRGTRSFELEGRSDELISYTYAALAGGAVKGFMLVWTPDADQKVMEHVRTTMRESFRPVADVILPDTAMSGDGTGQRIDLLAGLEIRQPERTRTGFFVDGLGRVLTSQEAVASCGRLTVGAETPARLIAEDAALGLALLDPETPLAPRGVAKIQTRLPRLTSEVAVAGFPYGAALTLPVLTFGQVADIRGLNGETDIHRLDLDPLPGDVGAPVIDQTGAVIGVLRAKDDTGAQQLPDRVSFAVSGAAVAAFLDAQGIDAQQPDLASALAPEDLTRLGTAMAVQVRCWQ